MGGLADELRRTISHHGPISVAAYMEAVLAHPQHGVYSSRDPFGAGGDFITAPEISQMFGELIGLWCAVVWQAMDGPDPVALVELGPGRGTLIADALRATRSEGPFRGAARLHLVETSRRLRDRQREALFQADLEHQPAWHDTLDDVPDDAVLVVANEFFDALPTHQFQQTAQGWHERLIDVDDEGGFGFVLAPSVAARTLVPASLEPSDPDSVFEVSPSAISIAHALGKRLAQRRGAALIVDYGHIESATGDTLQALRRHRFHDPLDEPGTADITAHVDFAALGRAATEGGAIVHGPVPQGTFLESLGIAARATALLAGATPEQSREVATAHRRLVDPAEMGTLFKVMAVTSPEMPPPPGFA
jgi:NADH dehydrogenase [ubiquinone] 1 alpha subcomplex assembly factor 7